MKIMLCKFRYFYSCRNLKNFDAFQNIFSFFRMKHFSTKQDDPNFATAGTMENVKQLLITKMGVSDSYKVKLTTKSYDHLKQYLAEKQNDLPERKMTDSFASALIPLSTNEELRDKYVSFVGSVRLGRLLEDMDMFAVYISHLHIYNPKVPLNEPTPYVVVTVLVDKIELTDYVPKCNHDIRLSGHVTYVGKSSMEVVVWLEQYTYGEFHRITKATFLMGARDIITHKATFVNALVATTDNEKSILVGGEKRGVVRRQLYSKQLTKVIPSELEQKVIHQLFIRTLDNKENSLLERKLPEKCKWMDACSLCNIISSFPENRNLHGMVFGGFIMRQALETSWALAYLYCTQHPTLKAISDVNFLRPVEIHNFVRLKAFVVFTKLQYFQITLCAEIWDQKIITKNTTSTFYFTFEAPQFVQEVFPHTYQEAILYIDGYRHFNKYVADHK